MLSLRLYILLRYKSYINQCMELFKKYSISFLEVDENIKCISKDNFYYDTDLFGEKIKKPIYTFGVNF